MVCQLLGTKPLSGQKCVKSSDAIWHHLVTITWITNYNTNPNSLTQVFWSLTFTDIYCDLIIRSGSTFKGGFFLISITSKKLLMKWFAGRVVTFTSKLISILFVLHRLASCLDWTTHRIQSIDITFAWSAVSTPYTYIYLNRIRFVKHGHAYTIWTYCTQMHTIAYER